MVIKFTPTLINLLESKNTQIAFCYPDGLSPTRKNVIDAGNVTVLNGGTNYFPSNPKNSTVAELNKLLQQFSEKTDSYQISLRLMKVILSHIIPSEDFPLIEIQDVLESILAGSSTAQGRIIVRRDRKVTQGTGALLSPNDLQTGKQFTNVPVLTIYQVSGGKGWASDPIWVPNIKLPHEMIYIQSK